MTVVAKTHPRQAVADLIEERGYRKGFVAEQAGIPFSSLSSILSGKRELSPNYAVRLARFFGVPVETFLAGDAA